MVEFGACKGGRAELRSSGDQDLAVCKQGRRVKTPLRRHVGNRSERARRLRHYPGTAAGYVQQKRKNQSEFHISPHEFHRTPIVTSLLGRPRYVKRTGTPTPGVTPLGTRTFT